MLILNDVNEPVDRVAPFVWKAIQQCRTTTIVRLFGRLMAYIPDSQKAYYRWLIVLFYRPAQHISYYQFSPPYLKILLLGRIEFGLVLSHWGLGLRLGEPLVWCRRAREVPVLMTD